MDYPSDFPNHLQHVVDAAIHKAEEIFVKRKAVLVEQNLLVHHGSQLTYGFIKPIFFEFAYQAARASEEGIWTGERVRHAIDKYLLDLTRSTWREKHPNRDNDYQYGDFSKSVEKAIKDSEEWINLQSELSRVATVRSGGTAKANRNLHRRGYRDPVRAWMSQHEIGSVKAAAKRLAVSDSVLKSIMADHGKIRYSEETLQAVLKAIGYRAGDQSGDQS